MKALCLTGWGQPPDALACAVPEEWQAEHVEYRLLPGFDALVKKVQSQQPDVLVGWSLGGQLAARLVAEGALKPRLLVLIAAPWQFVASRDFPVAAPPEVFQQFREDFVKSPVELMQGFQQHIARGDTRETEVLQTLTAQQFTPEGWKPWLEELGLFSCNGLDFSGFPRTLIIQGRDDVIVRKNHAERFASAIDAASLQMISACCHAPHLHDAAAIKGWIKNAAR